MGDVVYNEDCIVGMSKIKDKSIDMVLTDVPYGMSFQSCRRKEKHKKIENDNHLDWLPAWMSEIDRVSKDDAHLYIFCSHHNIEIFKHEIQKFRKVKNIIVWEKNNHGSGDLLGDYAPKHEFVLFCSNGNKKLNGGRDSNIIKASKTQNNLHPTEKPVALMEFFIGKSSEDNDTILDTFVGGGASMVAAKSLGRRYVGFEIDETYFNTTMQRLSAVQMSLF